PPRSTQSRSSAASDVYKRQTLKRLHKTERKKQNRKRKVDDITPAVSAGSLMSGFEFPFAFPDRYSYV
uniref:hypothetical protein n=1 Tax=Methanosarcina mazei TaxID=2209 RepID=UPI001F1E86DC